MKYFYKIELFYSMEICDCGSTFNPNADSSYIDRYALSKYNSQTIYPLKVFNGF